MIELNDYQKINSSFKRNCIYRIGNDAGFFSEINNMLMAMIFCLENNLQLKIYSANSNFGEDIWKDYLLAFTKHSTSNTHCLFNERPYIEKTPYPLSVNKLFTMKKSLSKTLLTQDIWPYIRDKTVYNSDYMVNCPHVKGNLTLVISILIKCIWNYNTFTKKKITKLIDDLNMPKKYAAIFVRRGDKYIEAPNEELEKYIDKVDQLTKSQDYPLFISSDDFSVITKFRIQFPNRNVYHFNFIHDKGYYMEDFKLKYSKNEQKNNIIQLLAQVEMLKNATYFVGTYSSNVGVFVGMARNCEHSYDVNDDRWQLW